MLWENFSIMIIAIINSLYVIENKVDTITYFVLESIAFLFVYEIYSGKQIKSGFSTPESSDLVLVGSTLTVVRGSRWNGAGFSAVIFVSGGSFSINARRTFISVGNFISLADPAVGALGGGTPVTAVTSFPGGIGNSSYIDIFQSNPVAVFSLFSGNSSSYQIVTSPQWSQLFGTRIQSNLFFWVYKQCPIGRICCIGISDVL